jgi:hypothetical protein
MYYESQQTNSHERGEWVNWFERATTAQLSLMAALVLGGSAAGTLGLPSPWHWAAGAIGVVFVVLMAFGVMHRRKIRNEPLRLLGTALTGTLNGAKVYRFRAVLGRGRPMLNARVEVRFLGADGVEVPLEPVIREAPVLLGPWTIAAVDRAGLTSTGEMLVHVTAEERGRTWEVERSFSTGDMTEGRFASPIAKGRGRMRWDPDAFDRVEP